MDRHRFHSVAQEVTGEPGRRDLRPREDQHLVPVVVADEVAEQRALAIAIHGVHELADEIDRGVARCDLDGPEFLELARQPGLLLAKGWLFRARQSFARHADEIRRFFTPAASHRARVAACLAALRRSAEVVVGVHVRHGDYRHFLGGRFFFEVNQYAALLRRMRELLGGRQPAFLLCSNAAQPTDAFAGLNATPGPRHQIEDLYALAACDYLIGPPSTYTMWASFYGQTPLYVVTDPAVAFELSDFEVFRTLERTPREFLAAEKGLAREGTGVR